MDETLKKMTQEKEQLQRSHNKLDKDLTDLRVGWQVFVMLPPYLPFELGKT